MSLPPLLRHLSTFTRVYCATTFTILGLIVLIVVAGFTWQQTKAKGRFGLGPFRPACGSEVDKYDGEIAP